MVPHDARRRRANLRRNPAMEHRLDPHHFRSGPRILAVRLALRWTRHIQGLRIQHTPRRRARVRRRLRRPRAAVHALVRRARRAVQPRRRDPAVCTRPHVVVRLVRNHARRPPRSYRQRRTSPVLGLTIRPRSPARVHRVFSPGNLRACHGRRRAAWIGRVHGSRSV